MQHLTGWVWFIGELVLGLFLSLLFWTLVLPLVILILLPIRSLVQLCLNLRYGKGRFTLASGIDAVFAHDQSPGSSSAPHMLLVQKGPAPSISVLRSRFLQHVFTHQDDDNQQSVTGTYKERLQSRFISNKWGWPVWERIPEDEFDFRNHVKVLDNNSDSSEIVTEDQLFSRMGALMQAKQVQNDERRPQWEFLLVPNYLPNNNDNVPGGQGQHFACLVRLHHAFGDGASFLLLLDKALADENIHWTLDPMKPHPLANSSSRKMWVANAKSYIFGILPFLCTLISAIRDDSPFIFRGDEGYSAEGKVLGWSEPLSLAFFKELASVSGTAFSSIVLTAFCGAMRKLQLRKSHSSHPKFRARVPAPWLNVGVVSAMIPFKHSRLQNSFSTFSVPCALGEGDVALRLHTTHSNLRRVSQSSEPLFNYFIMRFTGSLPCRVMDILLSAAGTPALFSNIPGPKRPLSLFGSQVVEMGGWLPLIESYGFGLTCMSSCGVVRLCLSSDSSIFPSTGELGRFIGEIEEELEMLGKIHRVRQPPNYSDKNKSKKRLWEDVGDKRTTA